MENKKVIIDINTLDYILNKANLKYKIDISNEYSEPEFINIYFSDDTIHLDEIIDFGNDDRMIIIKDDKLKRYKHINTYKEIKR